VVDWEENSFRFLKWGKAFHQEIVRNGCRFLDTKNEIIATTRFKLESTNILYL
jgi:hypothetical protein